MSGLQRYLRPKGASGPASGYAAWYDLSKNNRVLSGDSTDCTVVPDAAADPHNGAIVNAGLAVDSWSRDVPANADATRSIVLDGTNQYARINLPTT